MYTSIGVAALAIMASASGQVPLAAVFLALIIVIPCGTVLALSRMNRRPPRLDWGSFHLSFDEQEDEHA